MKLYLAADSSLELIRYLRAMHERDSLAGPAVRKRRLDDAINTVHGVNQLDGTAQRWLEHVSAPLHLYVDDKAKGTKTKRLVTHVMTPPLPSSAFIDIGHDVRLCAPQFLFTQLVASLAFVDAVCAGMELCGYYSRWHMESNVLGDPYYGKHQEARECTFGLPPVMQSRKAASYAERHAGCRGATKALSALRWVADCSASPMETATYLLLCLPRRLGGYGLPKPTLNPKLVVSGVHGKTVRYPDLFWRGANIDVEYNSDSAHSGEWSRYRDSQREIELTVAKYTVLPLTRPQLMNADEFHLFARGLRKILGIRARRFEPDWYYRRDELRRKLLVAWA